MRIALRLLLTMAALLALAAPALAAKITLKGDVTYRERIALPAGATLSVGLVDLARPEEPRVAAAAALANPGQVPLTFTLNFDEEIVLPGHSYALVAEIVADNGAVWFRNAEPYAIDPLAPASAILILVNFVDGTEAALPVVPAIAPILDLTWDAESIAGLPVIHGATTTLSIASDMRAGGRGGCNSWFAQAAVNGEAVAFSAVAATRMACPSPEITAQEQSFFAALAATRYWRIRDEKLVLADSAGSDLAIFAKSRY